MANEDKNKQATEVSKKSSEQKKARKARRFVIPRVYVPRPSTVAFVLPSYHVGSTSAEEGLESEISHTEYAGNPQHEAYTPIESKGEHIVHPEPTPYIAGGEYEPIHHTENNGNHHFTHDNHYGKPVTPLVGTLANNYGQTSITPIPVIASHTGGHKDYSYLTPPVVGVPESGTVVEDTTLAVSGTLDIHSAQKGMPLTFSPDNLHGLYGEFTLNKDTGEWSYILDNSHHQNLAQGETHTEILHVTVTSAARVSVQQDITVTVRGTNDIPVITSHAQAGATKEDGTLFVDGQVTASDVDHGALLTYTPDNTQGQYGQFTLNPSTGKWTYTLDNQGHQALAQGEHHTETMLVTVTDEHGAKTTQTVTVDVEGTNDKPVITSQLQIGAVKEDDVLAVNGRVTASDVDHGAFLTYTPDNIQGQYGSFALSSSSGRWTYKLDNNAHQALALGESHTEAMLVTVTDEHGAKATQTVTITVEGTNDKPVITSQAQTGAVKEDDVLFVRGQVTATDIDHGAVLTYTPNSLQGKYGSFTLNSGAGTWTYKLDNSAHQDLALGEHHTEVMLVTVTDEHGAKVTQEVRVEVTGTNDRPVITSGAQSETIKEDDVLFVRGQVVATDVDHHAVLTYTPDNLKGQYGSFTLNKSSGTWTYTLDNQNHQDLAQGEHHTETLLVTVTDEHGAKTTQQVTVEVEGTNDSPVITSQVQTGAVKEDDVLRASGQVTASDVDRGAVLTYSPDNLHGQYGVFTLNSSSGTWTYILDNQNHQDLAQGERHIETLLVTVTDEHGAKTTQQVTVEVEGTNDSPVITSQAQTSSVKEDATLFVRGQVAASDVDNHAVLTYTPDSLQGQYGSFTLNKRSGAWTYKLDNAAHQALAEGERHTETLLVTVTDEHGAQTTQQVTVEVEGTNDKPVITSSAQAETVKEDDVLTATGQVTASDVDHGAVLTYSAPQGEMTGTYGNFTLNPSSGVWHYKLDNAAHQALALGESHTETLHVTVTDDKGATTTQNVVVTVEGTNDKPVITSTAQTGSVDEDGTLFTRGQVTASDVDNGAVLTYSPDNLQGQYGSFTLNANSGTWTYTLDNQHHQNLAQGEKRTETLLVTVTDEYGATTTQQVTVEVSGTNDRPTITSQAQAEAVKEDDVLFARGQVTATDVDKGAVLTYTPDNLQGQYGSFTLNKSSGTWTYTLDNQNHQDLAQGERHTETLLVTVTDEHGAQTTQQVTVEVEGTNDRPVITSQAQTGSVTEDHALDTGGQVIATDVDKGAVLTYTPDSLQGKYGVFTLDKTSGAWHYSLNNAASQLLGEGEHYQEHMLVTVTDEHGAKVTQKVTVDVQGTNDVPVITSNPQAEAVKEDDVLFVRGQVTATDTDQHATLQYSASNNLHGQYGTFTLNPSSGGWTYTLDNSNLKVQALALGETHTETLHVLVTDNKGGTTTQDILVTVTGTNDRPVISMHGSDTDTGKVVEAGTTATGQPISGSATATGHLTGTDVDSGDTQAWSIINPVGGHVAGDGVYGHLTVNAQGLWTYTLDNSRTVTQALANGQHVTETFTVRATDSQGLTADHQITVNVTGSNDQAHITGQDTATLTEDKALNTQDQLHASGDLSVTDVDSREDHFQAGTINGQYGSLTVDEHGHWHYEADNNQHDVQALKATDSLVDTIIVHSVDGTEHQVVITINGTNDLPVIANTGDTGKVVEAGSHPDGHRHPSAETGTPSISGTLDAQETDKSDPAHWAVTTGQGAYGSLVINARTGRWEYTLDNSKGGPADRLNENEVVKDTFEVTDTDSSGIPVKHTVVITVTGSNDVPVISGTHTGAVTEAGGTANANAGTPSIAGDLTATDYDNNDGTLSWSVDGATTGTETRVGKYGTFTIDQNGHWNYQLDNSDPDTQKLQNSQNPTEVFTVLVTDSSGKPVEQEVTVTVHGTNDDPVLAAYAPVTFHEDERKAGQNKHIQTVALPHVSDVDDIDLTYSIDDHLDTRNSHPRWIDIDSHSGQITVHTDARILQHLSVGESMTEDVLVTVHDKHGGTTQQTLHLTIEGTNDKPHLTVLKVENNPGQYSSQQGMRSSGGNAHQPQLSVDEDSQISGKIFFNDVDDHKDASHPSGDTYTFDTLVKVTDEHGHETTVSAKDAGLTLDNDGHFVFDASAQIYQHLQVGQNAKVDVLVTVTDNHGAHDQQHMHFTVNGQNDNPTVNQVAPLHVDEDGAIRFTLGKADATWGNPLLQILDVEQDKLDVFNPTVDPKYGRLVDHGMGRFEFIPAHNQNSDTFNGDVPIVFKIDDNHGGVVTERGYIHVNPVDDAPNVKNVGLPQIDEDSQAIHISEAQLLANTADIDNPNSDLHITSLQLNTQGAGQLTKDPNGGWLFTPAPNWNSHKFGHDIRFSFTVSDGYSGADIQTAEHGQTPSAHATLHVNPLPDPALIVTDTTKPEDLSVTDGSDLHAEGYLTVTDPDKDEDHFRATSSIPGTHGFASIDRSGHWHYTLNDKDPAVLALGAGEHMLDTVIFRSADGTPHTINIDITGKNEVPEVTQVDRVAAIEDGHPVIGKLHVSDKDTSDVLHFTMDTPVPGFTIDPDTGVYTFDPTATAYNHLREGIVELVKAVVTITDSSGASVKDTVEIRVTGTNDAPEATGAPLPNLYVDDSQGNLVSHPTAHFDDKMFLDRATDPDTGDKLTIGKLSATGAGHKLTDVHLHDPSVGTLKQDGNGGYDFIPAAHFTGRVEIDYTVTDGIASTPMHTSFEVARHVPPQLPPQNPSNGGNNNQGTTTTTPPPDVDKFEQDIYNIQIAEGRDNVIGTIHQVHVSGTHHNHDDVYGANHLQPNAHGDGSPAYGYLKLQPNGGWEYHLNQHNSPTDPINKLAVGETATETFTVRGPNAAPTTLVVTITGTNDDPEITHVAQHIENAQNQMISGTDIAEVDTTHVVGQVTARDIDNGDELLLAYKAGVPTDGQGQILPKEFLDGHGHLAGLTVNGHGGYTFTPDSAHFGTIPPGQTRVFRVPIEVTDGHGGTDTQEITLTVVGHNRPPEVTDTDIHLAAQKEDFVTHRVSTQELLTLAGATDPDGDTLHVTHVKITGSGGAPVSVQDNGQDEFIFTSKQDQHGDLHFTFEVTDGMPHSQVRTVSATLPVTAVNDNPVAADFRLGSVTESTTSTPKPTRVFTEQEFLDHIKDPDIATDQDVLHLTGTPTLVSGDAQYGTFKAVTGGYQFVPKDPNFHGTVHVTYEVTDSSGAKATAQAAIVVTPTNDPAVITNPHPDFVEEDRKATAHGQLGITDVDGHNEESFHANSHIGGQFGYLQLDKDGNWNYVLTRGDKPGVQQLSEGGKFVEHFQITSQDGTHYDLTVDIKGDNDNPVLQAITARNGTEGGNTVSGQLSATDIDAQGARTSDNPADILTFKTSYIHAGFTLNTDGSYTLDMKDSSFEHLAQGQQEILTIPVVVEDNHGGASHIKNLVITVTGTNDVPVLNQIAEINANEDDGVVNGQLTSSDVDSDNLQGQLTTYHLQGSSVAGFTLNPDGSYTFDPHAYNSLQDGETKDIEIPIVARDNHGDSTSQKLVIHLTGTNDAANISGSSHTTVTDGPSISATTVTQVEHLRVSDPDHDENSFAAEQNIAPDSTQAGTGLQQTAYGHLSITADGHWQYHVDDPDAIEAIPHGQTVTEMFTVESVDGTLHQVSVDIVGSNNAAVITGDVTGSVTEDSNVHAPVQGNYAYMIQARGHLVATDPDAGESGFDYKTLISVSTHPNLAPYTSALGGKLEIDPDGNWNYYIDNRKPEVQSLGAGDSMTDTVTVESKDGTQQVITITINGTNDGPTVSGTLTLSGHGTEDQGLTITKADLLANASDVDTTDVLHIENPSVPSATGTVSLDSNGNLVFNPASNFNGDVTVTYEVVDSYGAKATATATFTVDPVNDPGMFSGDTSGNVQEDVAVQGDADHTVFTTGVLSVRDPDAGEGGFATNRNVHAVHDPYGGTLSLDQSGAWTYSVPNAHIQKLGAGETDTVTYRVRSLGGDTQDITITITGTNDAPMISQALVRRTDEDTDLTFRKGYFGFHDADSADKLSEVIITSVPDASDGQLLLNGQVVRAGQSIPAGRIGHLVFHPASNFNGDAHFDYKVGDGHAESGVQTATLHVTAVNDPAHITVGSPAMVREHSSFSVAAGNLLITDADGASEELFNAQAGLQGQYGQFEIMESGQWKYVLTGQHNAAVQGLKDGETLIDTVMVTTKDGTTYPLEVTISGENDAPTVTSSVSLHTQEDTPVILSKADLLLNVHDADNTHAELDISQITAQHAVITDNQDGTWTLTPEHGYTGDIQLGYTVSDLGGLSTPATAILNVAPQVSQPAPSPAPVVSADESIQDTPVEAITLEALASNQDAHTGAQAYLNQLGVTEPQHQLGAQSQPQDLDLGLNSDNAPVLDEHGLVVADTGSADANSADNGHKHHDELHLHDDPTVDHHDWTDNHG
ncbi:RTX toxin [Vibrio inusitatus NBRC 102082]|uniref:RTX toxin n=1 Tax=Vibrio inusitatus NBRC 102082 TaxID=1219070 RepID=A0A4Y3I0I5_9VIBR|nr:VCBS domain-containing protein [Vibrio inusitatus]GEA52937.1 RTX toxin [Vibrio inusitatus NBRC 102082]